MKYYIILQYLIKCKWHEVLFITKQNICRCLTNHYFFSVINKRLIIIINNLFSIKIKNSLIMYVPEPWEQQHHETANVQLKNRFGLVFLYQTLLRPFYFKTSCYTLYNVILRIAMNFLETRVIIKISIHPCCPRKFDRFL